jgi:hypothetical protein
MSKRHLFADVRKALNANGIAKPHDLKKAFCATLFQAARNSLIPKRRDVRVVEGARLESDALER